MRLSAFVECRAGVFALCLLAARATAQENDDFDDLPDVRPGLIAEYSDVEGALVERVDESIAFAWGDAPPDARLAPGEFEVRWRGLFQVMAPGEYTIDAFTAGELEIRVDGQTLLAASNPQAAWSDGRPIELSFGHHALEVRYRQTTADARLGLFWTGPRFAREPITRRHLFHEAGESPDARFETGRRLARALRCEACHRAENTASALAAPALSRLAGAVSPDWLSAWIEHGGHSPGSTAADAPTAPSRMPDFDVAPEDARAIAAWLLADSGEIPSSDAVRTPGDVDRGRGLFRTVGCLACHRAEGLGSPSSFGGGDLSQVAEKRPPGFFAGWLENPAATNPAHRMPVFELTDQERADLAAYLATLGDQAIIAATASEIEIPTDRRLIERGSALSSRFRCGSCHELPPMDKEAASRPPALDARSQWRQGCLAAPDGARQRPGFWLSAAERAAVQVYFSTRRVNSNSTALDGEALLAEHNCLSCHGRGSSAGVAPQLTALAERDPELAPRLPALTPPSLESVGDKLHDEALRRTITRAGPTLRPWLAVRMPRYNLSPNETRTLVEWFVDKDRIPARPETSSTPSPAQQAAWSAAGARLVTSDGFGCTSCHRIGATAPRSVELAAQGTDLTELADRMRHAWFERWVRDPARIVPRMEMPSIQQPVRGVLDDRLDEQLAAVWHVLNTPGFEPPPPHPVRIVRARNVRRDEPVQVLTDVLEQGDEVYVKPFLAALGNRHNVLFDLATNRLAAWWIGDAARQRTRDKSWYWETGGANLAPRTSTAGDFTPVVDGRELRPSAATQFATEIDAFEHLPGGVKLTHRALFDRPAADGSPLVLKISQSFTAIGGRGEEQTRTGFRRAIRIGGLPPGAELRLAVFSAEQGEISPDARSVRLRGSSDRREVQVVAPADARFGVDGRLVFAARGDSEVECELLYTTDLPVDQFPLGPPPAVAPAPRRLDVVPGFEALRLPLADEIMPTGFAWRADGTLVFCSLKGRVWLARDGDADGLEDSAAVLTDGLPAPYGVAVTGETIDVLCKYGLLRLHDQDDDGRAERTEVLASGWGYTDDYHDWAVGLPRDEAGAYYVALPCQQDDRDPAAAHLRGRGLKLTPRTPTADNPRRYAIAPFCEGLRFPMGLALSRAGELFASDNQGNYNPFNELNHLRPGGHYGFINALEQSDGTVPPLTAPAIDIPHPWTRSVNGLAFLYTPVEVRRREGRDLFGPFEGHLIGCEYDTRRLVRMSLEQVDGVYQGAVYPFSREPTDDQENFEGPVVCAVAPDGDLYIGNMRDSGWGGGRNTGSIVRLRLGGDLPLGIAEVRAAPDGFVIEFTGAIDADQARRPDNYRVASHRRVSTPAYGGDDQERRAERIMTVRTTSDARQARIVLAAELREGFVYEIRVDGLAPAGGALHPAEAYYTLRKRP